MQRMTAGFCGLLMLVSGFAPAAERDRHVAEIELAKVAIGIELLNGHSPDGRFACSHENPTCAGPAKSELGLALLRNIMTKEGVRALLEVGAFGLDADLAEDYDCAVATGGPEVKRQLATVSAKRNRATCLAFFRTLVRSMPYYKDVDVTGLCLSEAALSREYARIGKIRAADCEE